MDGYLSSDAATNLWEDDGPDVSQWINTLESILNRSEIDGSIEIESVGILPKICREHSLVVVLALLQI